MTQCNWYGLTTLQSMVCNFHLYCIHKIKKLSMASLFSVDTGSDLHHIAADIADFHSLSVLVICCEICLARA